MRRLREFDVKIPGFKTSPQSSRDSRYEKRRGVFSLAGLRSGKVPADRIQVSRWHATREYVCERLFDNTNEAIVYPRNSETIIAIYSEVNLAEKYAEEKRVGATEDSEEQGTEQDCPWKSHLVGYRRESAVYENRNVADFHWQLLEGANHDSPFLMSSLERKAMQNPSGWTAYFLELLVQYREMFSKPTHRV